ncbi:MAG: hypothetical protein OWR52_01060 [Acidibacillus sp.]|nr:hypothetical protein [Acidibacillus sp.]
MNDTKRIRRMGHLYTQLLKAKEQEQQQIRLQVEAKRHELEEAKFAIAEVMSAREETVTAAATVLEWYHYESLLELHMVQKEQAVSALEVTLKDAVESTKIAYQKSETWKRFGEQLDSIAHVERERKTIVHNDELALTRRLIGDSDEK